MILWLLILALASSAASAAAPEIGVGVIQAEPVAAGFWYDPALPHTLNLTVAEAVIGVGGEGWHLDYIRSGVIKSDAIAPASDPPNLARYRGYGRYDGVEFAIEWHNLIGAALLYVPRWIENTTERGIHGYVTNVPNLHVAPVVGYAISGRRWSARLTETFMCISDRCESGVYPPIWRNTTSLGIIWKLR